LNHKTTVGAETPATALITPKQSFIQGMKQIVPVASAGIIDGLVFGVLARQAGFSVIETILCSLLVNAGSSQFAAVGLVNQGIIGWPMLVSTLLLNARHFLYGLSLGPFFKKEKPVPLAVIGACLNDETYALKMQYLSQGNKPSLAFFYGASLVDYLIWNGSTAIGAIFGTIISHPEYFGLDFAFIATFLGFLAINLRSFYYVKVALIAAVVACTGFYLHGTVLAIILGTGAAVLLGFFSDES
jgi:4-azaleucine resistance transporter AzlC